MDMTKHIDEAMLLLEEAEKVTNIGTWYWEPHIENKVIWSKNLFRILGYDPNNTQASVENWFKAIHPDDLSRLQSDSERAIAENDVTSVTECRVVRPDGSIRHIKTQASGTFDKDGVIISVIGTVVDLTNELERIEEEKELIRLKTISTLSAGVAHDFNNYLQIISGNINILKSYLDQGKDRSEIDKRIENIQKANLNASTLVSRMMEMGKSDGENVEPWSLSQHLESLHSLIESLAGETILVHLECEDIIANIHREDISQVVINLCKNAKEAITNDGNIWIRCFKQDDLIHICVKDDGCGMSKDVASKIYDPFFTTKGSRRGTGLGLAATISVIERNHGDISVESEPGVGTEFTIRFPLVGDLVNKKKKNISSNREMAKKIKILVVEDNEDILEAVKTALELEGHIVESAKNGVEGKEVFTNHDLIITDVNMPKLRGDDMAKELWQDNPELKVIFLTGYKDQLEGLVGNCTVVGKPVGMTTLCEIIKTLFED